MEKLTMSELKVRADIRIRLAKLEEARELASLEEDFRGRAHIDMLITKYREILNENRTIELELPYEF